MRNRCIFFFLILTCMKAFSTDFKLEKIKLQEDVLIHVTLSILLTEDNLLLVIDAKAGDIKIYDTANGKLEKVLGRKGFGPNEFSKPLFGYYGDKKLFVADVDQKRIFIYERLNRLDFIFKRFFFSSSVGEDYFYKDNFLYSTGHILDKSFQNYKFLAIDLKNKGNYIYFLPSYLYYGLSSDKQYRREIYSKPDLSAIGGLSYLDSQDDFAYLIWGGNLKVFRINLKTRKISTFGHKTPYYIKPYASKKLIHAFADRIAGAKTRAMERKKLSYIIQLFTTQKNVLVIYEARGNNSEDLGYMMQFYTLDGTFIKEVELPKILSKVMCFDKKSNILYSRITEPVSDEDEVNYLVKCKIPVEEILK